MTESFYDVLGVASDATTEEIRAAYRARLKESHPDLSDDEDAGATTKRIIRARDVLTDEAERATYDRDGHAAYVGRTDAAVDEGDVSSAAAAARRAGWATGDGGDETTGSATGPTGSGRRNDRARRRSQRAARERAAQERAARERVDATGSDAGGVGRDTAAGTAGAETTTAGDATGGGSGAGVTGAGVTGSGATDTGTTGATGAADGFAESAWSWNPTDGYSVRQRRATPSHRRPLFAASQSLPLLTISFVLYPVLLFGAVFPPFPLAVNVLVGLCTVFLVGYLQSIPEVGVVVFGAWSLATPVALAIAGVALTSLVGVVALTATWLPLGLSVLTFSFVR